MSFHGSLVFIKGVAILFLTVLLSVSFLTLRCATFSIMSFSPISIFLILFSVCLQHTNATSTQSMVSTSTHDPTPTQALTPTHSPTPIQDIPQTQLQHRVNMAARSIPYGITNWWLAQPSAGHPLPPIHSPEFILMNARESYVWILISFRLVWRRNLRVIEIGDQVNGRFYPIMAAFGDGSPTEVYSRFTESLAASKSRSEEANLSAITYSRIAKDAVRHIQYYLAVQNDLAAENDLKARTLQNAARMSHLLAGFAVLMKYEADGLALTLRRLLNDAGRARPLIRKRPDDSMLLSTLTSTNNPGLRRQELPSDFAALEAWAREILPQLYGPTGSGFSFASHNP